MKLTYTLLIRGAALLFFSVNARAQFVQEMKDVIVFGNSTSENEHTLAADNSTVIKGLLNQPARILLAPATSDWKGGSITFTMKVDSEKQNYVTVRLSGNDVSANNLNLICNGKQVGYRHLGDIEMFDLGCDAPFKNGRFYYKTSPLPVSLTKGKQTIQLEIRSTGHIWGYGSTFEKYQLNMTEPTRGLYTLSVHTAAAFLPPAEEMQGNIPERVVAPAGGDQLIASIKERVNKTIGELLAKKTPLLQVEMQLLAKAYRMQWSLAYNNPVVINKVTESLDSIYSAYRRNPTLAEADPATWNADWFGLGITGQVLWLLKAPLKDRLNKEVTYPGAGIMKRRDAYASMLVHCRDWHAQHRRFYTNQSMINDLYGIYYANKGLQTIDAAKASPEKKVLRYLYESLGMQPWLGSEGAQGPTKPVGDNYWQLTQKGLTRELGYVGNYGEVLDWVAEIYEATRPEPELPGNPQIKAQAEKIALARTCFRYPAQDAEGFTAMRQQVVVGWRDVHFPGDITYLQRSSWDGTPFQIAAATRSAGLIGYAQQLLRDNQFFNSYSDHMKNKSFRVTAGLLPVPDQYDFIKNYPTQQVQLPMTNGQPDFVFADEEDGVVAIKNGEDYFYASLYWRARNAINFLARVHLVQPRYDRIATIFQEEEFEPNGNTYLRPPHTNFGFGNGGPQYPGDTTPSAHTGEALPVAKIPAGIAYKDGDESPYAGRASIYKLMYDRYLILMNNSNKEYQLQVPADFQTASVLTDKKYRLNNSKIVVKAHSTCVLYKAQQ